MDNGNEYDGMTDEEIAELKLAESDGESVEGDGGDAEAERDGKTEADAKPEGDEGKTPEAEAEAEADEQAEPPAPPLRAKAPANVDEALAAIRTDEDALATRFDEGDITAKEFRDGLAAIAERRETIRWDQRKAELASEMTQQAKENAWNADVREFLTTGPAARISKSHAALVAFDEHVKAVTADPANASLSNKAQLDKAYKAFASEIGEAFGIKPGEKQAEHQQPARKPREIPPTLARVPAAEVESTDNGKFAALDRLATVDPEAYERAIFKMSAAEAEEYANAAG